MGLLTDFFISTPDEFGNYGESENFCDEDRCQYRYITPLEAAGLLTAIENDGDALDSVSEFKLLTPENGEEWTISCPPKFTELLAQLDNDSIPAVAERCTTSIDSLDYTQDDYIQLLSDLNRLAIRANASKKSLYLWISL